MPIARDNYDLVKAESGSGFRDLTDQVGLKLQGLSIVYNRRGKHKSRSEATSCVGVIVLVLGRKRHIILFSSGV